MAYLRKGEKNLLVAGNFQNEEQEIRLSKGYQKLLLNNYESLEEEKGTLRLKGHQLIILDMGE